MPVISIEPTKLIDEMKEETNRIYKHSSLPIKMKLYDTNFNKYRVFFYEKGVVCQDDSVSPNYRSVVLDASSNELYSISVPKAIKMVDFVEELSSEINHEKMLVNEIVEGTMINLWYDKVAEQWEISTRHAVGAGYTFYRKVLEDDSEIVNPDKESGYIGNQTFRKMFIDALHLPNSRFCTPEVSPLFSAFVNEMPFFQHKYIYSFVLQHPENHLVFKIDEPRLYLTHMIETVSDPADGPIQANVNYMTERPEGLPEHIWIPRRQDGFKTYREILEKMSSVNQPTDMVGIMITNTETGARTKVVAEVYKQQKEVRGNNPNMLFQYLCLYKIHKITEFLNYFPWYRDMFNRFRKQYITMMMNVHKSYVARYIKHTGEVISKHIMPHVWRLHHNVFLPSMANGQKKIVTLQVVQEYFKTLNPIEIYYMMSQHVLSTKKQPTTPE